MDFSVVVLFFVAIKDINFGMSDKSDVLFHVSGKKEVYSLQKSPNSVYSESKDSISPKIATIYKDEIELSVENDSPDTLLLKQDDQLQTSPTLRRTSSKNVAARRVLSKSSGPYAHVQHRICMVSDFFYPNMGGVEMHIWCLAQCLMQRGHKVIILTHSYPGRQGVRYMTNGLKVYYLPLNVVYEQVILPTLCSFFVLFRNIMIREMITIVHGHQSTSVMTNECVLYARTMGIKTCYTDHSIFAFNDLVSININHLLKMTVSDVDHVICVSNTCRENMVLRGHIHPSLVSTIPNAVDTTKFYPNPSKRYPRNTINIIVLCRLVYRKGIDLLVKLIPLLCAKFSKVYFIIGGDGPKKLLLEEMRERCQLYDRLVLHYRYV